MFKIGQRDAQGSGFEPRLYLRVARCPTQGCRQAARVARNGPQDHPQSCAGGLGVVTSGQALVCEQRQSPDVARGALKLAESWSCSRSSGQDAPDKPAIRCSKLWMFGEEAGCAMATMCCLLHGGESFALACVFQVACACLWWCADASGCSHASGRGDWRRLYSRCRATRCRGGASSVGVSRRCRRCGASVAQRAIGHTRGGAMHTPPSATCACNARTEPSRAHPAGGQRALARCATQRDALRRRRADQRSNRPNRAGAQRWPKRRSPRRGERRQQVLKCRLTACWWSHGARSPVCLLSLCLALALESFASCSADACFCFPSSVADACIALIDTL